MAVVGYDFYAYEPGEVNEVKCRVCGTICEVSRNVFGPTTFVAAMAKEFRYHDAFVCPHASQPWHEKALRLIQAIEESPSPRVAALMTLDLQELLAESGHGTPTD